ncbi:predicted protein [Aspergillus terreus NIH2624]|uniref:Uncharacterized protein n=1 Tax=Aspergillus terreus (strain NIH 2624 / FGSC A1156) TaxID=341663 RepID=Q0C8Q3_ASPTN|nr:uncharacterized protein ATEG_09931 [Aspergillus terreus NIH2624]EAU30122.1 predicted protein [Aspergillus terreus NIH2624]
MSHTGRLSNVATPSRPNTPTTPRRESGAVSPQTVEAESDYTPPKNECNRGQDGLPGDRSLPSLGLFKRLGFAPHNPWALNRKHQSRWCDSIGPQVPKAILPSPPCQRDRRESSPLNGISFFREPSYSPIGSEITSRRNAMARLLPSPLPQDEIYDKSGLHAEVAHWYSLYVCIPDTPSPTAANAVRFRLQMWSPIASMMGMNWEEVEELAWQVGKEGLRQLASGSPQAS